MNDKRWNILNRWTMTSSFLRILDYKCRRFLITVDFRLKISCKQWFFCSYHHCIVHSSSLLFRRVCIKPTYTQFTPHTVKECWADDEETVMKRTSYLDCASVWKFVEARQKWIYLALTKLQRRRYKYLSFIDFWVVDSSRYKSSKCISLSIWPNSDNTLLFLPIGFMTQMVRFGIDSWTRAWIVLNITFVIGVGMVRPHIMERRVLELLQISTPILHRVSRWMKGCTAAASDTSTVNS